MQDATESRAVVDPGHVRTHLAREPGDPVFAREAENLGRIESLRTEADDERVNMNAGRNQRADEASPDPTLRQHQKPGGWPTLSPCSSFPNDNEGAPLFAESAGLTLALGAKGGSR